MPKNTDLSSTSIVRSYSSAVVVSSGPVAPTNPALLYSTSRRPKPSTAAAIAAATSASTDDVGAHEPGGVAELVGEVAARAVLQVGDDDLGAFGDEPADRGLADAGGAARDDGDLAVELCAHDPSRSSTCMTHTAPMPTMWASP